MASYIEVVNGQEVRTEKGKGRTRLGFKMDANGDYRIDPSFDLAAHRAAKRPERQEHFYITLDQNGTEVSRKVAGKGRPAKGFTKDADGNFRMTLTPVVPANEISVPAAPVTA